jgi:hypothetical protein
VARIRSIHPGLTSDESYMSMSMTAMAAWTPLWMQCDDHGIFEWKPIVLKALIFPADNVDFSAVLEELLRLDCVRRLEIEGKPYGMVRNFARYQRPKNPSYRHFKADNLPTDVASYIGVKGAATPALPQSSPSPTEIPPQMKEEGGRREEVEESTPTPAKPQACSSDAFERFKKAFPRRDGANPWQPAEKKFNALVKTGVDPEAMIAAAVSLAREEGARGNIGTKFIPQAVTWLNQQRFQDYAAASFDGCDTTDWDAILTTYKKTGHWSKFAGNDPESPSCQCPREILEKHGIRVGMRTMQ